MIHTPESWFCAEACPNRTYSATLLLSSVYIAGATTEKKTGLGPGSPPDEGCRRAESAELIAVVVASSDGVVRTVRGPKRRHCGSFAHLAEGTALSIFELLGYRSSKVPRAVGYMQLCTFLHAALYIIVVCETPTSAVCKILCFSFYTYFVYFEQRIPKCT